MKTAWLARTSSLLWLTSTMLLTWKTCPLRRIVQSQSLGPLGTGFQAVKATVSKGGRLLALNRPSSWATASLERLKESCADGGSVVQLRDSQLCDAQPRAPTYTSSSVYMEVRECPQNGLKASTVEACTIHADRRRFIMQFASRTQHGNTTRFLTSIDLIHNQSQFSHHHLRRCTLWAAWVVVPSHDWSVAVSEQHF